MSLSFRDLPAIATERYDLIVVGGGIQGIMVALEAVRRGLKPLLVERDDFGAGTSHNSLRIVHGGLRYLQQLDFRRARASALERRWFMTTFADLVAPLVCLMPLYNEGLRRPAPFRIALALNDLIACDRNRGLPPDLTLPRGRVLGFQETLDLFPGVAREGLSAGALWYDAIISHAPRLFIEALSWAVAEGACAVNYLEAQGLILADGQLAGCYALDHVTGETYKLQAPCVINAAGPWARKFSASCGDDRESLCQSLIAWNAVFKRPAPATCAVAVKAPGRGRQTYFFVPWKGALMVGTGYAPGAGAALRPDPTLLDAFVSDLNEAIPGLALQREEIARVYAGLMPGRKRDLASPARRNVIIDHGATGGTAGLFSISAVKLTAAREVADRVLARTFPGARARPLAHFRRRSCKPRAPDYGFYWMPEDGDQSWKEPLRRAIEEEAVVHLEDLLLRRSAIGDNPRRARALAVEACGLFDWDEGRVAREIAALEEGLALP